MTSGAAQLWMRSRVMGSIAPETPATRFASPVGFIFGPAEFHDPFGRRTFELGDIGRNTIPELVARDGQGHERRAQVNARTFVANLDDLRRNVSPRYPSLLSISWDLL